MADMENDGLKTRGLGKLVGVVVGMFVFGFLLVPLYDIVCEVTGFNGKTSGAYQTSSQMDVDDSRFVTVQFLTNRNADMPWEFRSKVRSMKVKPGQINETEFFVRNKTGSTMVGKAIPSVTPFKAADYLHKTECFCFESQELRNGEELDMPLRFIVDRDIPSDVGRLTLSYTLYDITENTQVAVR